MSATYLDLQQDVIAHWGKEGISYTETENVGFEPPEPSHFETVVKEDCQRILDSEELCLYELGYDSMDDYKKSKEEEKSSEKRLYYEDRVRQYAIEDNLPTDMKSLNAYHLMYMHGTIDQLREQLDNMG